MKDLLILAAFGIAGICLYEKFVKKSCGCHAKQVAPTSSAPVVDASDYIATCEERMSGSSLSLANEFEHDI